eukprot:CAMPEP_0174824934 /NCGR_PEP_ID=MMETSP1107-20130205/39915_1 /TAXON_ID=36770 /ORGANISM="Paraphysomonas vestita, Strain GFlagA" /LENGTH=98 /DNA_ID=CAMNT_0016055015 /DNA_START=242 /DNA_END=536 /DNA_ORIENTATION=+
MDDARDAADAVRELNKTMLFDRELSIEVAHGDGSSSGTILDLKSVIIEEIMMIEDEIDHLKEKFQDHVLVQDHIHVQDLVQDHVHALTLTLVIIITNK